MVFVDESGFYLLPGHVRTYAPCGQTPILRWPYTRDHLSVRSGITMDGRLYTRVRDEALDSLDSVEAISKFELPTLDCGHEPT